MYVSHHYHVIMFVVSFLSDWLKFIVGFGFVGDKCIV